jgi:hypothetical protein
VRPRVAGRTERIERRAVGIGEVKCVFDAYRAVIAFAGLRTHEFALDATKLGDIARGLVAPDTRRVWHEANAIYPIAVIEAIRLERTSLLREGGAQGDVDKRVARRRSLENQLEDCPALDFLSTR